MVGNLHEWVADPAGTFYGGYYQDVASVGHGEGCGYLTTAHEARYHDYSTGFRCCSDVAGAPATERRRCCRCTRARTRARTGARSEARTQEALIRWIVEPVSRVVGHM